MKIRKAAVEGSFYPADREELKNMIRQFLENAKVFDIPNLKAIVSPHAGYIYSGPVAGFSFKQLYNLDHEKFWKIFIIAPSHFSYFSGVSVGIFDTYQTPMGLVNVSKIASKLLTEDNFHFVLDAHVEEHSVEVQLPFLQYALPHFEIIPIITGEISPSYLGDVLKKYLDENSLILVSSDLSHYYPYENARKIDENCNKAVEGLDLKRLQKCEACGKIGLEMLIYIAKQENWKSKVLCYMTSGDTAGPKDQVVGYGSYAFYKE
ncbi:MAG: AmmeMemoRadiSam system protein B [Caldiserica bacterium CG02_land_8_20_14_3_00_36_38]|nr:AmmeMemoRadiSam system protein B [Caldisericota bacterium]OIP12656.1 MAG: AmmeMemoRadiSam system protein B [Caldisericum sp. CG2_30_36_11]PIP49787.1 MAG: AmmeMemoRadiSam system protein B [Caldiserica bacterium CG23_combo_of_CG06-09_8_20_14_all_35_60]PIV54814.1 MAG: AmmeMemoRadiSam system protein B [Caldiserica bacterium CG02_land_8_20_14_3_00_36_38]PIW10835.1 MAG: AmmeMemoRadiSam system protein B [Caldiserica bacterium CG17_big_fil_post_rev_8_21_14_2_50_35_7]PIX28735.1 MAG: AmmeMemoRadiSam 